MTKQEEIKVLIDDLRGLRMDQIGDDSIGEAIVHLEDYSSLLGRLWNLSCDIDDAELEADAARDSIAGARKEAAELVMYYFRSIKDD